MKLYMYCTPVNKAMSEISNCSHYFLSNPGISLVIEGIGLLRFDLVQMKRKIDLREICCDPGD